MGSALRHPRLGSRARDAPIDTGLLVARRAAAVAKDRDKPSLRWLAYLAQRVEGLPLSLLVASRPAEPASQGAPMLAVRAEATIVRPRLLSEGAAAAIIRDLVGAQASDEARAATWRQSGGNPFYLHELLRAQKADGRPMSELEAGEILAHRGVGLTQQVPARVRRLDQRALWFAQALATLGDGCELRQAAALARVGTQAAIRLASLGSDERDSAHRAAARLLHAEGAPPGKVTSHLAQVWPAGDPWVLARLREAGRAAIESGAPQAAAELLERALAEPPAGVSGRAHWPNRSRLRKPVAILTSATPITSTGWKRWSRSKRSGYPQPLGAAH